MATKPVPAPKPVKLDDPEQSRRFIQTAQEIGASDDEKGAESAFKKVVGSPGRKPGKHLKK